MGWWTEYASRNSNICGQNFLLKIAVFRDGGSIGHPYSLINLMQQYVTDQD